KQFDVLIEVFALLAPQFPDWDLVIWGEGPVRDLLLKQISALNMEERIALPGRTPQPWDELAKAEAFALTSSVEGFPNVLLEAMALGLPCIAFDCPSGPAEMTRNGQDALLVPLGDVAGLCKGLEQLMQDDELRKKLGKDRKSTRLNSSHVKISYAVF